jgi:predicted secreted hydrolase
MRCPGLVLLLFGIVWPSARAEWKRSEPGWVFEFPRDELSHPDFKTEWWYFTGNLREPATGRAFGYQLTFFRQGVRPPGSRPPAATGFVTDHFWFAHFALSDLAADRFRATERVSRGSFGEAGSDPGDGEERIVWIRDWSVVRDGAETGRYRLSADAPEEGLGLSLELRSAKPPVIHGVDGVSAKSPDPANASHYFSHPRLATSGEIRIGDRRFQVEGASWYDREWSTSVLAEGMTGWDWFSIQFDGPEPEELMLFRLRDRTGERGFSSGTWIHRDGRASPLADGSIRFTPLRLESSRDGKAAYPVEWRVEIPDRAVDLRLSAATPDQELRFATVRYWEGAMRIRGTVGGAPVSGSGYLEMTGYASDLPGLR